MRHPAPLRAGDRVAVVSPAGPVDPALLEPGEAAPGRWALELAEGRYAPERDRYHAGTDEQRAADRNAAFRDPQVRGIWASRGGYGSTRILSLLDFDALAADPKVLVGFSDITALLVAAWERARVATVHGQMVERLPQMGPAALDWLRRLVMSADVPGELPAVAALEPAATPLPETTTPTPETATPSPETTTPGVATLPEPVTVVGGVAEGRLLGGNLSLLGALTGTPHQLDARGAILLVEDIGETPASIDRLLTQLRDGGALAGVAGVAIGEPVVTDTEGVLATFAERVADLGVPVVSRLLLGHTPQQLALGHGTRVRLDADRATIALLEPVVQERQPAA